MKIFILLLFSLIFASCEEKPKNPVAEYGNTLIDAYGRGQSAADAANLDAVRKAVQIYRASHGEYPESLSEIDDLKGSGTALSNYDYDAVTGNVSLKK